MPKKDDKKQFNVKEDVKRSPPSLLVALCFIVYLVSLMFLAIVTDTNPFLVFIGLLPYLLYIIVFFLLYNEEKLNYNLIWLLPILFSFFFYLICKVIDPLMLDMDVAVVSVVNILFAYILNIFIALYFKFFISVRKDKSKKVIANLKKQLADSESALKITKENVATNIRSIEDKCKAMNFAIGRVYSTKHGGSEELRSIIRVDKDLYNIFSDITTEFKPSYAKKAFDLIEKILHILTLLESTEKKVFKKNILGKSNQRIIDILDENDKDPVMSYYTGIKEVCIKVGNFLKDNYDL